MNDAVYLLPGRGNRLSDLGDRVCRLGFDGYGRELAPSFARLRFAEQVSLIQHDLASAFWDAGALLIGHSYGTHRAPPRTDARRFPWPKPLDELPSMDLGKTD